MTPRLQELQGLWVSSEKGIQLGKLPTEKIHHLLGSAQVQPPCTPGLSRPVSQHIPKNSPKNNPKERLWSHLPAAASPNLHFQVFCFHLFSMILVLIIIFPKTEGYSRGMVGFFSVIPALLDGWNTENSQQVTPLLWHLAFQPLFRACLLLIFQSPELQDRSCTGNIKNWEFWAGIYQFFILTSSPPLITALINPWFV